MKNYYETLEITKDIDKAGIKKAYRALAKKYHPDKNKNNSEAIKKFQEINEAYSILGDEKSREEYDKKFENFQNASSKNNSKRNFGDTDKYNFSSKKRVSQNMNEMSEDKFNDLNGYFKSFFGFNAKSDEMSKDKLNRKANPIDTSDMFESFFRKK